MQRSELLTIQNLKKYFPIRKGIFHKKIGSVKAVDGFDLAIRKGETIGLVGESGCGKTTVGRLLVRLIDPTDGNAKLNLNGTEIDIFKLSESDLKSFRRRVQLIFQDPYASLNPRKTVRKILEMPLEIHRICPKSDRRDYVDQLLEKVGLSGEDGEKFPHEFSGGQRQRIGIARALAVDPMLIIADEPVSALDVSVQSQVINLLRELQDRFQITYIFIAHDLSVVRYVSDRVAVMYLGKIVELATSDQLYKNPQHPYTKALLSAVPAPDPRIKRDRIILSGDVPNPADPPSGCRFRTRCPITQPSCAETDQQLIEIGSGHSVACHVVK